MISAPILEIEYTASAGATTFTYPWWMYEKANLIAYKDNVLMVLDVDYNISNLSVQNDNGGDIVLTTPAVGGEVIKLIRLTSIHTVLALTPQGQLRAETLNMTDHYYISLFEEMYGARLKIVQSILDLAKKSVQLSPTDPNPDVLATIGDRAGNANKYLIMKPDLTIGYKDGISDPRAILINALEPRPTSPVELPIRQGNEGRLVALDPTGGFTFVDDIGGDLYWETHTAGLHASIGQRRIRFIELFDDDATLRLPEIYDIYLTGYDIIVMLDMAGFGTLRIEAPTGISIDEQLNPIYLQAGEYIRLIFDEPRNNWTTTYSMSTPEVQRMKTEFNNLRTSLGTAAYRNLGTTGGSVAEVQINGKLDPDIIPASVGGTGLRSIDGVSEVRGHTTTPFLFLTLLNGDIYYQNANPSNLGDKNPSTPPYDFAPVNTFGLQKLPLVSAATWANETLGDQTIMGSIVNELGDVYVVGSNKHYSLGLPTNNYIYNGWIQVDTSLLAPDEKIIGVVSTSTTSGLNIPYSPSQYTGYVGFLVYITDQDNLYSCGSTDGTAATQYHMGNPVSGTINTKITKMDSTNVIGGAGDFNVIQLLSPRNDPDPSVVTSVMWVIKRSKLYLWGNPVGFMRGTENESVPVDFMVVVPQVMNYISAAGYIENYNRLAGVAVPKGDFFYIIQDGSADLRIYANHIVPTAYGQPYGFALANSGDQVETGVHEYDCLTKYGTYSDGKSYKCYQGYIVYRDRTIKLWQSYESDGVTTGEYCIGVADNSPTVLAAYPTRGDFLGFQGQVDEVMMWGHSLTIIKTFAGDIYTCGNIALTGVDNTWVKHPDIDRDASSLFSLGFACVGVLLRNNSVIVIGRTGFVPLQGGRIKIPNLLIGNSSILDVGTSIGNVPQIQKDGKLDPKILPAATGLGTAAYRDVGTADGNVVEVVTGGKLPILDGSNLTNLPSSGGGLDQITDEILNAALNLYSPSGGIMLRMKDGSMRYENFYHLLNNREPFGSNTNMNQLVKTYPHVTGGVVSGATSYNGSSGLGFSIAIVGADGVINVSGSNTDYQLGLPVVQDYRKWMTPDMSGIPSGEKVVKVHSLPIPLSALGAAARTIYIFETDAGNLYSCGRTGHLHMANGNQSITVQTISRIDSAGVMPQAPMKKFVIGWFKRGVVCSAIKTVGGVDKLYVWGSTATFTPAGIEHTPVEVTAATHPISNVFSDTLTAYNSDEWSYYYVIHGANSTLEKLSTYLTPGQNGGSVTSEANVAEYHYLVHLATAAGRSVATIGYILGTNGRVRFSQYYEQVAVTPCIGVAAQSAPLEPTNGDLSFQGKVKQVMPASVHGKLCVILTTDGDVYTCGGDGLLGRTTETGATPSGDSWGLVNEIKPETITTLYRAAANTVICLAASGKVFCIGDNRYVPTGEGAQQPFPTTIVTRHTF